MQKTDFSYEIIIINDSSTDNTSLVINRYKSNNQNIKIINHVHNMGNAHSFYDGLSAATGEYFCVLDADDYYTNNEKLQLQINFFKNDILTEYVGITHNFIFDFGNCDIIINKRSSISEFTYLDYISRNTNYYHTSTYMFRNIYKNNVPEYFKEDKFRGDTARTALILQSSNKKIKILDFFGSAYVYDFNGIWSNMSIIDQNKRENIFLEAIKNISNTNFEIQCFDNWINDNNISCNSVNEYQSFYTLTVVECLDKLKSDLDNLYLKQKDFLYKNIYYSHYIDSLCTTMGYINTIYHPECLQNNVISNHLAIVIDSLEIKDIETINFIIELIELYSNNKILVLFTNILEKNISLQIINIFSKYSNIIIKTVPSNTKDKLYWLSLSISEHAPYKAYYFSSFNDPYLQSAIHCGLCKNIFIPINNQGLICGLSNTNNDFFITRDLSYYSILYNFYKKQIIYIPKSDSIKPYILDEFSFQKQNVFIPINSSIMDIHSYEKYFINNDYLNFHGNKLITKNIIKSKKTKNVYYRLKNLHNYVKKIKFKSNSIGIKKTIKLILIKSIFR